MLDINKIENQGYGAPSIEGAAPSTPNILGAGSMVACFLVLLDMATTTAKGAIVHTKELSQNASAQKALNSEQAAIPFVSIPKAQRNKHTWWTHHWGWYEWKKGWWVWKILWTNHVMITTQNKLTIQNDMAKNQGTEAQRAIISQQLGALQQDAQVGETNINQSTDSSMEQQHEANHILDMVKDFTNKLLMNRNNQ